MLSQPSTPQPILLQPTSREQFFCPFRHQPASDATAGTLFYNPHDIRAVTAAIRETMDRDIPPPPIFPTDNDSQPSDTEIMRSYAIDTLFDSAYYTGDTEEIETTEALRAPDRAQFIEPATHQDRNRPRREPGTTASVEDQNTKM
jgi:hypothetical protein